MFLCGIFIQIEGPLSWDSKYNIIVGVLVYEHMQTFGSLKFTKLNGVIDIYVGESWKSIGSNNIPLALYIHLTLAEKGSILYSAK